MQCFEIATKCQGIFNSGKLSGKLNPGMPSLFGYISASIVAHDFGREKT